MAHLMKFHLLQWEVIKVKLLINSNMTLTVLNLHQKTDPKVPQGFKGQGHYDKVKSRSHHDAAYLQPLTNVPTQYQLPIYSPDKIFKLKVTTASRTRSIVKSRSDHDVAHLHILTNVPSRDSLPSINFLHLMVKVTTTRSKVKLRSNHDNTHQ